MSRQYERYALLLDTESGPLGRIAMQLLDLGIDVLYVNDVDEGELLARQETAHLGAVLIPSNTTPERVEKILKQICPHMAAGSESLVMAGLEPEPADLDALRDRGAKWCLWEPYDERQLRFVIAAAMSIGDAADPRSGLRIPTNFSATVSMEGQRKEVTVHNLSSTGAYFDMPDPFPTGSCIEVEIPLGDEGFRSSARTVYSATGEAHTRTDIPDGMGVAFDVVDFDDERLLRGYIADWLTRFWV